MPKMFKKHFNKLGFRSPRWQIVQKSLFNQAQFSRSRMDRFHQLLSRFKKK